MNFLKNATFLKNGMISLLVVLSSSAAFGLGRLSVLIGEKEPIAIENYLPAAALPIPPIKTPAAPPKTPAPPAPASEIFVASKTGKSYYFPWCGIVKRIKEENKVTFNSRAAAEAAGYKPGNCAGLK